MNRPLRIAIVYDRVFPASYGGAERWFHTLAESLVLAGHRVTYLTSQHWPDEAAPHFPGVEIVPLAESPDIYAGGRRRIKPVFAFGAAVARHLIDHGASYDVVHSTSMSPVAAHAVVALSSAKRYVPLLDWWEVWGTGGWRSYLGPVIGALAGQMERILARSPHIPVVYSELHGERLASKRGSHDALRLTGVMPKSSLPPHAREAQPYVLLANRLIPEKQTSAILPALLLARCAIPSLGAVIVGSGPSEPLLRSEITRLGLSESVTLRKDLSDAELEGLMENALCLALLSQREGYGLVALEAMRYGTPALILEHPDSAASERIADDENGVLVHSLDPEIVGSAILSLHAAGTTFRERTLAWRRRNDGILTVEHSLPNLISCYQHVATERRTGRWRSARP